MASQTPEQVSGSLQVFFEEPFYVGLFEKREAGRQTAQAGIGTRSQQTLQAQRELHKQEKKAHTKAEREAEAARRFAMAQQKRKEKHRGR